MWVVSQIQKDLAFAIKAADGKLNIDDALVVAATPCVLVDYAKIPDSSLKYIARAMRHFFRRNPRYARFTKAAVAQGLRQEWLPNLEEEEKREMLADFAMTPGVDADNFIIFDPVRVENITKVSYSDKSTYGKDDYTRINLNGPIRRLRMNAPLTVVFHTTDSDGYISAPLNITAEEWYQIIRDASPMIKEFLGCYIQLPDGKGSCTDIERMFGISADRINSRNTSLGKRAQAMLGISVYDDENGEKLGLRRVWTTPMLKGRDEPSGNTKFFKWQMRPELLEAARRLANEEQWSLPPRSDI